MTTNKRQNCVVQKLNWSEESLKRNCGYYVIKAFEYISKRGIKYRVMLEKDNDKLTAIVSRDTSYHRACTAYPVECTKEVARVIRERWGENVSIFAEV